MPGVYVPALYDGKPVSRQWLAALDSAATTSVILTPDTDLSDMYLIEIARGCGWGCRFCLARPAPAATKATVVEMLKVPLPSPPVPQVSTSSTVLGWLLGRLERSLRPERPLTIYNKKKSALSQVAISCSGL